MIVKPGQAMSSVAVKVYMLAADPDVRLSGADVLNTVGLLALGRYQGRPSGQLRECAGG